MNSAKLLVKVAYRFRNHSAFFHLLRLVWRSDREVSKRIHFKGPLTVLFLKRKAFRIWNYGRAEESAVENDLFWEGLGNGWEGTSLVLWMFLARKQDKVLDVGANIGIYSLAAKFSNQYVDVTAFEPFEMCYRRLVGNVALNNFDVSTNRLAVSDRTGRATLYDRGGVDCASLEERKIEKKEGLCVDTEVEIVRLDECLPSSDERILIKIDVEGHEAAVLRGLGTRLDKLGPTMLIEVLDERGAALVGDALAGSDYRIYAVKEGLGVYPVKTFNRVRKSDRNYLLCQSNMWINEILRNGISHIEMLNTLRRSMRS